MTRAIDEKGFGAHLHHPMAKVQGAGGVEQVFRCSCSSVLRCSVVYVTRVCVCVSFTYSLTLIDRNSLHGMLYDMCVCMTSHCIAFHGIA